MNHEHIHVATWEPLIKHKTAVLIFTVFPEITIFFSIELNANVVTNYYYVGIREKV
jgi:hypothetical protein